MSPSSRSCASASVLALLASALLVVGCDADSEEATPPVIDPSGCTWQAPDQPGTIQETDLQELSGLSASARHAGSFWAHNDAGNDADLFLLGGDGHLLGRWKLQDTGDKDNRDWEDSAVGPCRAGSTDSCVWIGDIGDNNATRSSVRILRLVEPASLPAAGTTGKIGQGALGGWQRVSVVYPEGPQDAEALAALPDGRLIIATKREDGLTRLYRVDAAAALDASQSTTTAVLLGTLRLEGGKLDKGSETRVTASSISTDGGSLALRSREAIWLWHGASVLAGDPAAAAAAMLTWKPLLLPSPNEPQGEALTFDAGGALWTSSEGTSPPLHRIRCL